jgi:hypothetical protein
MARLATPSIIAVFVLTLATSVSAETRVGLQGGVNLASIRVTPAESGFTFSTLTRPGVGGLVDVGLDDRLSVRLEPMFLGKGSRFRIEPDALFGNQEVTGRFRLSYLELPVFLRLSAGGRLHPYVMAGPTVGYLLKAKARGKAGDEETDQDVKDDFKKLDFGLGLGGGVRVPVGGASLFVEGRYVLGLWNVTNDTYNSKLRTKGYQVGAGLTFLSLGRRTDARGPDAARPPRAQRRQGPWIGFGMGHGSAATWCPLTGDCAKGDSQSGPLRMREGGATAYLKLGGTLSSRVTLGAELTAWSGLAVAIPSGRRDATLANLLAAAYFYPVPSAGFFLKGGVGVSSYTRHEARGSTSRGVGLGAGIGYDVRIGSNVSLTPAANFVRGFIDDTSTSSAPERPSGPRHNVLDVTLGVTVH